MGTDGGWGCELPCELVIFQSFAAHGENELRLKACGNVR